MMIIIRWEMVFVEIIVSREHYLGCEMLYYNTYYNLVPNTILYLVYDIVLSAYINKRRLGYVYYICLLIITKCCPVKLLFTIEPIRTILGLNDSTKRVYTT